MKILGLILAVGGFAAAVISIAMPGGLVGIGANPLALPLLIIGVPVMMVGVMMLGIKTPYTEMLEEMRRQRRKKP